MILFCNLQAKQRFIGVDILITLFPSQKCQALSFLIVHDFDFLLAKNAEIAAKHMHASIP